MSYLVVYLLLGILYTGLVVWSSFPAGYPLARGVYQVLIYLTFWPFNVLFDLWNLHTVLRSQRLTNERMLDVLQQAMDQHIRTANVPAQTQLEGKRADVINITPNKDVH